MKKSARIILFILVTFLLGGCGNKTSNIQEMADSEEQEVSQNNELIADVELAEKLILDTPGTEEYLSNQEISEIFSEIKSDIESGKCEREECYRRIQKVIADLHCAHMAIWTKAGDPIFKQKLGIQFQWFGDELRISGCMEAHKDYLGMRVTKIADRSVDDIVKEYAIINSYETAESEKTALEGNFWDADLEYLGLLNDDKTGVDITVTNEDGEETTIDVPLGEKEQQLVYLSERFDSIEQLPISYRNREKNQNYCFEGDAANHTMYFLYLACADMDNYSFAECFDDMMKEMTSNSNYQNLIIDVRWNGGGNRSLMVNALNKYYDELSDKQIILITGKDTFSAAFQLIGDCLEGFENVKIYGEKTGQAIHHYTEAIENDLLALNCWLILPTVKNEQPVFVEKYGDVKDGITPDVEISQTYEDYEQGVDTIYERIVSDLNN